MEHLRNANVTDTRGDTKLIFPQINIISNILINTIWLWYFIYDRKLKSSLCLSTCHAYQTDDCLYLKKNVFELLPTI